ncbi:molybdopterin/thiamine biosynthesis adenylyltransferase [Tumebacillus permanentifrigoris]|uniref:Molybdopterin/thiamine biosynthesis adenylyltransferase n=2 Tax=Tumebacillus permanentifrigoris TaxID=378543 RepID=A0A316D972_9BACL|nr:molybdopterin/thiamine biosynthesis adenylyltransferase [Tumebacillus permanentifrigoris]
MMRPKIKTTIPYFVLDKEIQIGEELGVACFIDDPTGSVALLVQSLNGEHDTEQIFEIVSSEYPDISKQDVLDAIQQIDELGFLEDGNIQPQDLTPYLTERYKANLNYFSLFTDLSTSKFEIQEKINRAKISLIGIGGLGSQILYHLSAIGFHNIKALDYDRLELSNFNRQLLYSESDIGELKTGLAQKRIAQFNPNVNLQIINKKIEGSKDVLDHIQGADLVICVADKPTMFIRKWVNEAVVQAGIPMISGGVLNTRGRFFSIVPGTTGCIQCAQEHNELLNPKQKQQLENMKNISYNRQNATISSNVGMLAGIMVNEAIKHITGIAEPYSLGRACEINFVDYTISEVSSWDKADTCSVCSALATQR